MAILNVDNALPSQLWTAIRLFSGNNGIDAEQAHELLSPNSLSGSSHFQRTLRTLEKLEIVTKDEQGKLHLKYQPDSTAELARLLRTVLLDADRNSDLAAHPNRDSRDLTIILCFFLSSDPLGPPVTASTANDFMSNSFSVEETNANPNDTRWNSFGRWAHALGLGTPPLFPSAGARPMVADCTSAVRDVLRHAPSLGSAVDTVRLLREQIPVLPGGKFASELHIGHPGESVVDAALSYALLRGESENWLTLGRFADASRTVTLADPDEPGRRVSDIAYRKESDE
ncbi:protein DpdG [Lentzea sp. NPDC058436]|uniref:protein DpdG n=1 Tax=Lentzea sp. NPDC058436 TaxID=3346499 RepID=UPI003654CDF1